MLESYAITTLERAIEEIKSGQVLVSDVNDETPVREMPSRSEDMAIVHEFTGERTVTVTYHKKDEESNAKEA